MTKGRRDLFRLGSAAAVAWWVPKDASAGTRASLPPAEAARQAWLEAETILTRSVMDGQVGTTFTVTGLGRRQPQLTLTSVTDLPSAGVAGLEGSEVCFSALFHGVAREAPLAQRTYEFDHPALGPVSIFLVPVGRTKGRPAYEAVFNRTDASIS